MARLRYFAICSVDGFVADASGRFDWAMPDTDVHEFVNDLERPVGTYLYGRRMYDVMAGWDIDDPDRPTVAQKYAALWQRADKLVFSSTLVEVWTARTRLVRRFDPAVVRQLKTNSMRDLSVGGPGLAAAAFQAGLVDDVHLVVCPIVVGGGLAALPRELRQPLDLVEDHWFSNGMVYLRYRTVG